MVSGVGMMVGIVCVGAGGSRPERAACQSAGKQKRLYPGILLLTEG